MQRILASVSLGALFAASAAAQCINISSPGTLLLATDETVSAQQALGLTYPNPLGGALAAGYTHCLVSPNGWIMLTDGVTTVGSPGTFTYGGTGNTATGLGGGAGSMPLLAPFWGDGDTTGALAGEGVFFKASTGPGIPAEITFIKTRDYAYTVKKDFRVLIYDTGEIKYQYSAGFAIQGSSARYIGVSTRNGIATVPPQTPLGSAVASTPSGMCFKTFPTGAVNLADHEIDFIPDGFGGWVVVPTCGAPVLPPPSQLSVGTGCYSIPGVAHDSFYQLFPDTAAASAALQGNSMTLSPIPSPPGYVAIWNVGGAASYVTPVAATSLTLGDDETQTITPSVPMATPFGSFPQLSISHNAIITLGAVGNHDLDWTPTGLDLANGLGGAFYSWSDYKDNNTTPTASGTIKYHEAVVGADTVLYVTWDNVDRWASPQVNCPSTLQFQLNLTSGQVDIVWVTLNTNTTSTFGTGHLVGFSAPGASIDPGSVVLSTALPIVTFPDVKTVVPMALSVNVLPGLTITGDTVPMTWTVSNVPEASHILANLRACNIVFSIAPAVVGGYDLGSILNIPPSPSGCNGYVFPADAFVDVTTVNGTGICTSGPWSFSPPPSLIGLVVTTQAIALAPAGVYNGNTNNIGGGHSLWTSNAVQQTYYPL